MEILYHGFGFDGGRLVSAPQKLSCPEWSARFDNLRSFRYFSPIGETLNERIYNEQIVSKGTQGGACIETPARYENPLIKYCVPGIGPRNCYRCS